MGKEILPEDLLPPDPEVAKREEAAEQQRMDGLKKIDDEALAMGWSPKDKWRGDPEKWISSDRFVQRGKTLMPILNERLDSAHSEITELKKTLKKFGDHHSKTLNAERARHIQELESTRKKAFEAHDAEAFDEADRNLATARAEGAAPEPDNSGNNGAPDESARVFSQEEYGDWKKDNDWYKDQDMGNWADTMALYLRKTNPDLKGAEFLKEITKLVSEKYPQKFENPNRARPNTVADGGMGYTGPAKGKKTFADLPDNARKECNRFVRDIEGFTKEQYVRDYFEQGTYYELDETGAPVEGAEAT